MHTKETLQLKQKDLEKLLTMVFAAQHKNVLLRNDPRSYHACGKSLLFTAAILISCLFIQMSDWTFILIVIAAPVISFIFFRKISKYAETWPEEFDMKLLAYQPVDLNNFKWLQKSTESSGTLNYDILREWIVTERFAISELLSPKQEWKNHIKIKREMSEVKILKFLDRKF